MIDMSDLKKHWCFTCKEDLGPDYDPQMCCSGRECGCRGLPTNPPFCSDECWDNYGKNKKPEEVEVKNLGIELGEVCNDGGCTGLMVSSEVENCSCHLSAPCGPCTSTCTLCEKCSREVEQ